MILYHAYLAIITAFTDRFMSWLLHCIRYPTGRALRFAIAQVVGKQRKLPARMFERLAHSAAPTADYIINT